MFRELVVCIAIQTKFHGHAATKLREAARAVVDFGGRVSRDQRGTVSIIYAVTFSAVLGFVAVGIDFGLASLTKTRQQRALDAATLAASDVLGLPDQDVRGAALAKAYYKANTKIATRGSVDEVTLDASTGRVSTAALTSVMSTLLRGIGVNKIDVHGRTVVAKGASTVEVALVLDNSGSMGVEIDALKVAAKNMTSMLFSGLQGTERMRMALVPFAASVKVGSYYAGASWIDSEGLSPVHNENISGVRTRFQLFSDVGRSWKGCVEARPAPHDVSDAPPATSLPSTLFVPMFAPDEPDSNNSLGKSYSNNYLIDDKGSCSPQPRTCLRYSRRGNCQKWSVEPLPPEVAQSRICKYAGQSPSGGSGPNQNCTTAAILPLTSVKSQVDGAIDSMLASGWTNILEGAMWGWRVLSDAEPFTQGRPNSDGNNRKYLIIMTDGENTYKTYDNHNGSMYGAFGYKSKGRLGTNSSQLSSVMDSKTIAACANAKATGIMIYTIAFRDAVTNAAARLVLNACASDSTRALTAADSASLGKAFEEIGRQISQLRVAG